MEWNKLTTRNIAEDEKDFFNGGIEFVWDGKTPEIDEEVLDKGNFVSVHTMEQVYSLLAKLESGVIQDGSA